ncbi:MAG: antibiotic biosynthesis monooxygenase [Cyclobacteriaceae bacterium]|nr:antibiotic biosynthesis monooxygenase [Cyclobacteriaceae bacterium HetDA_MAG_MS6]
MELLVIAKISAKEEFVQEVKESLTALLEPSRNETGNLEYSLFQDTTNSIEFLMYEKWVTQDAFQKHNQMPYLTDFVEKSKDWLAEEMKVEVIER